MLNFDKYKNTCDYSKELDGVVKRNRIGYFRMKYDNYQAEQRRIDDLFKQDALDDVGLLHHTKADQIFDFAAEHSRNKEEVYNLLIELSKLFGQEE